MGRGVKHAPHEYVVPSPAQPMSDRGRRARYRRRASRHRPMQHVVDVGRAGPDGLGDAQHLPRARSRGTPTTRAAALGRDGGLEANGADVRVGQREGDALGAVVLQGAHHDAHVGEVGREVELDAPAHFTDAGAPLVDALHAAIDDHGEALGVAADRLGGPVAAVFVGLSGVEDDPQRSALPARHHGRAGRGADARVDDSVAHGSFCQRPSTQRRRVCASAQSVSPARHSPRARRRRRRRSPRSARRAARDARHLDALALAIVDVGGDDAILEAPLGGCSARPRGRPCTVRPRAPRRAARCPTGRRPHRRRRRGRAAPKSRRRRGPRGRA